MNHLVTVPNNVEGQQFVASLRKFLKNTRNGVMVRGRGNRLKAAIADGASHARYRQDLPIRHAERLAVYLRPRPTYRYKTVTKTVSEWVRVPTKWA
jgi:hypothetical protein